MPSELGVLFSHDMDPTPSELQAISTLKEVRDWVGIHDAAWQGVCKAIAAFKFIREVVLVPPDAWDKGVRDAEAIFSAPPTSNGSTGTPLPARPIGT